jgi:hypothetical protein
MPSSWENIILSPGFNNIFSFRFPILSFGPGKSTNIGFLLFSLIILKYSSWLFLSPCEKFILYTSTYLSNSFILSILLGLL